MDPRRTRKTYDGVHTVVHYVIAVYCTILDICFLFLLIRVRVPDTPVELPTSDDDVVCDVVAMAPAVALPPPPYSWLVLRTSSLLILRVCSAVVHTVVLRTVLWGLPIPNSTKNDMYTTVNSRYNKFQQSEKVSDVQPPLCTLLTQPDIPFVSQDLSGLFNTL